MTHKISRVFAFVLCVASAHAVAGVGGQSAGVIPTGAGTNTDPSAAVQQQSAGFVQQNAANGGAAGTPQGTASSSTAINGVAQPGSSGAGGARDKALDANGSAAQAAAPAVPAAPPPPPPTYVSNVKRVTSASDASGATTTTTATALPAPGPPAASAKRPDTAQMEPQAVEADALATAQKPAAPHPAPAKPAAAANTASPAAGKPAAATKSAAEANIVTGGSGAAPEGYTFYLGIGVAMALLVFALTTYLRTQKDETARRRPG